MKTKFFLLAMALMAIFLLVALISLDRPAQATKGKIVLGVCEPLSGPMKDVGDRYVNAVKFSIEKINARGGVLGKELVMISEDSALKPDVATRKATKLILEDKADFIMTGTGSHISLAMMKVAEKYKKIFITYGTEAASITGSEFNPYTFRACLNTDQHSAAIVAYFAKYTKFKKFYILCQDYAFGREAADGFKRKLKTVPGAQIVGEDYHPIAAKDFAPYVSKIMASGAEVVLTGNWGVDLDNLFKAGASLGWKVITGNYFLNDPIRLQIIKEAAIGHVTADSYMITIDNPENKKFVQEWYEKHKGLDLGFWYPDLSMGRAYYAIQWLAEVIKKAKSTDAEKIIKAWEGMSFNPPWGKVTMRACDHQMITPGVAAVFQEKSEFFRFPYIGKAIIIPEEELTVPPAETGNPRCK
ncbi:MAG: branched-chain amino acid ABC transporter substrate-binding protein [Deltaproteobacteria bacterium]|nr:branched-chain amino acid ABC transporter substrate-binding protein [Deltaproteobacteria bacterium]